MKKKDVKDTTQRILGRQMARELTREEIEQANGSGPYTPQTLTASYPSDNDPSGSIWA